MNYKRICRALMCLVLICCLMVQTVPRADATGAGLAATITGAAGVTVSAPLVVGASLIALGVMADSANPLVFEAAVDTAVETISTATDYIKDGAVELLRTVDALGNQAFYVSGDFMETLRQGLFSTGLVSASFTVDSSLAEALEYVQTHYTYYCIVVSEIGLQSLYCSQNPFYIEYTKKWSSGSWYAHSHLLRNEGTWYSFSVGNQRLDSHTSSDFFTLQSETLLGQTAVLDPKYTLYDSAAWPSDAVTTPYDLSLGQIPTYSLDGTVQDNTFKDYMSKQIRFQNQDSPEDPEGDESNYDWMVPLSLGAAGTVYAMTQAEQWFGSTPSDFSDYETVTDYTIVDTPTVGGFPGILTTPNIGAGTDDDTIPVVPPAIGGGTTTIDPVEGTLSDANAQTFLDSIGSFFSSWFDSILKWLEAIWELIKAGVITLAEAIAAIPAAIAEAITDVLVWAFVPSESYLDAEVTALCSEFPLADSCKNLITAFRDSLSGLGGEPPVIYIHLEDYEGSYNIGGTVPILDMRWYARYKPTVDTLLSSLLWIFFIWRVLVHAPSIISGVAGDVEAFNSGPSGGYFSADNPYRGQFERPARGRFESRRNRK